MTERSMPMRVLCWICVVLAASTCTGEICFAQGIDSTRTADSTEVRIQPEPPETHEAGVPILSVTPSATLEDSLTAGVEETSRPVYRKWWVLALVSVAIAVVAVLVAGGSDKKADEDLPDFPDPPDR